MLLGPVRTVPTAASSAVSSEASRSSSGLTSVMADATIVAIFPRSGITFPDSSGWLRFVRRMTTVRVSGSIQRDVPVQPVWPKEPAGKRSPRFDA